MTDDDAPDRALLLDLRERAAERVASTTEQLAALRHDRESSNDDDEHDPDGATLSAEWSRLTGLADAAYQELRLVDDALERLADGTYGTCLTCGREIPAARLRVRPFAEQCVPCAERHAS